LEVFFFCPLSLSHAQNGSFEVADPHTAGVSLRLFSPLKFSVHFEPLLANMFWKPQYAGLRATQQFGKSTWHPSNFGKTRKIGLQQIDKPTW
jgi:hypothetical protein